MSGWLREARYWTPEQREEHLRYEAERHTRDYNDEAVILVLDELTEQRERIAELERDGAKIQGLNQQLAARVAELEAEATELRKDKERLDWVGENHADVCETISGDWGVWTEHGAEDWRLPDCPCRYRRGDGARTRAARIAPHASQTCYTAVRRKAEAGGSRCSAHIAWQTDKSR